MKRILITGAEGFIGRNLSEYLKGFYEIFATNHHDLELLNTDRVRDFIEDNKIDIIVHSASIGGTRKTAYDSGLTDVVSKNLRIFFNLVRNLNLNRKMIFFGSGAEYSMCHYKPRMKEDYFDKHIPEDSYGFSKYLCSKYIINSERIYNLRLFGVFGKYEDYRYKFISNAIIKNLFGLPITINQNAYFDYLYIQDLLKIVEHFINNRPKDKCYNVVTGEPVDLITIANKINQIADKQSKVIVKNKGLNTEYTADNSKILEEIGKFKFTQLVESLKELYAWHKVNLDKVDRAEIKKDPYLRYCRKK